MRVQLKHPRIFAQKIYPKGVHELPDGLASDWFFKAAVESKDVLILPDAAGEITAPAALEVAPVPEAVVAPQVKSKSKSKAQTQPQKKV